MNVYINIQSHLLLDLGVEKTIIIATGSFKINFTLNDFFRRCQTFKL